ncbi:MAG TPA: YchJ family protein [Polyangiales bacterium]
MTDLPIQDPAALSAACMPFIRGEQLPRTAADLMASRYVAYTTGDVDYLLETNDPDTRDEADREAIEEWSRRAKWLGLEIVSTERGGPDDQTGQVEFIARYTMDGAEHSHHERSQFRRRDGKWFFLSGDKIPNPPARRPASKVGRNDPCSCGSGKKYKKCCALKSAS